MSLSSFTALQTLLDRVVDLCDNLTTEDAEDNKDLTLDCVRDIYLWT